VSPEGRTRFSTPSLRWLSKSDLPQLNITTLSVRLELQNATPPDAGVAKGEAPTVNGLAGRVAIHSESHQLGVTRYRLMSSEYHIIQTRAPRALVPSSSLTYTAPWLRTAQHGIDRLRMDR